MNKSGSLTPYVVAAILFHLFLSFHNYCGVDGANYFSYYSQYVFGPGAGGRCNYFSASFSGMLIPHLLSWLSIIPYTTCIKIFNAFAWIACAYLAVKYFRAFNGAAGRWWFMLLAFNPVAVINIHYHVQYDAAALFLITIGLAFYLRRDTGSLLLSGLSWALAVSMKAFPALLVPLFLFDRRSGLREKAIFYASFLFFFIIPEIPWLKRIGFEQTFLNPLSYRSFHRLGFYRIVEAAIKGGDTSGIITRIFILFDNNVAAITFGLIAVMAVLLLIRRIDLFRAMGLYFALLLLICTRNAPQSLIFVIPFLVLFRKRWALVFANASYALILAFFYLLDGEMNGSYCLLKQLRDFSISQGALSFWEGLLPQISLYIWGFLFIAASFTFACSYRPVKEETSREAFPPLQAPHCAMVMLWACFLGMWTLTFFSVHFNGNPFSHQGGGQPDVLLTNAVLQPPSTVGWYGTTGSYKLRFHDIRPGESVLLSGDSYYTVQTGEEKAGPFRGDGNKYYSHWWVVSYRIPYEKLKKDDFVVWIENHLCSIRGINTITAKLIGPGEDWSTPGHSLYGKIDVMECDIGGDNHDAEYGEREGRWMTIRPRDYRFSGSDLFNIFNIILAYTAGFFILTALKLETLSITLWDAK